MSAFADIPESQNGEGGGGSEFRQIFYTKIIPGVNSRIRILDSKAVHFQKYFIPSQRISIIAPEDEEQDPIWQNNGRLLKENPNSKPNEIKGFIPRQNRYVVNVLNRTLVKRTPSGSIVFPGLSGFPTHDPETGELIANIEPTPLNRVEILERGPTLFSQLNQINQQVCDDAGNPLGLTTFDIVISATGQGRKMVTNVIPYANHNDVVEIPQEELYDIENEVGIRLQHDEIVKVLNGVSLKDIFAARRGDDTASEAVASEGAVDNFGDGISKLFGS